MRSPLPCAYGVLRVFLFSLLFHVFLLLAVLPCTLRTLGNQSGDAERLVFMFCAEESRSRPLEGDIPCRTKPCMGLGTLYLFRELVCDPGLSEINPSQVRVRRVRSPRSKHLLSLPAGERQFYNGFVFDLQVVCARRYPSKNRQVPSLNSHACGHAGAATYLSVR